MNWKGKERNYEGVSGHRFQLYAIFIFVFPEYPVRKERELIRNSTLVS